MSEDSPVFHRSAHLPHQQVYILEECIINTVDVDVWQEIKLLPLSCWLITDLWAEFHRFDLHVKILPFLSYNLNFICNKQYFIKLLQKNNTGYFLNSLLISEVATGYKALHITDSSNLTLSTQGNKHSERQGRVVPERDRETAQETAEDWAMRERWTFIEVNQTAANYTENKQSWEKHTLFLTGISEASGGKITVFTGKPSVWQEFEHVWYVCVSLCVCVSIFLCMCKPIKRQVQGPYSATKS